MNSFAHSEPYQTSAAGRVPLKAMPRVHNQAPVTGEGTIVELGVIGENQHTMSRTKLPRGGLDGLQLDSVHWKGWHVRVSIGDIGSLPAKGGDDLVGGRLARVADAPLVGDTQHEHTTAFDGTAIIVESLADEAQDVGGHRAIDLIGQGDEPRLIASNTHLPGQVEGIHGDTVPADARAGIEGHETEGFRRRCIDDFPTVDVEIATHDREFVGESDVYVAEDVLVELGQLSYLRGQDLVDSGHDLPVERGCQTAASGRDAADHFGNVLDLELRVPR